MVKLNLSAIQNPPIPNNSVSEKPDLVKQSVPETTVPVNKKKMSLNSLISWIWEEKKEEENKNVLENISNTEIEINDTKQILDDNKENVINKNHRINLNLSTLSKENNTESITEPNRMDNLIWKEEKPDELKIAEKQDISKIDEITYNTEEHIKEEAKVISISDWDTIWNLLTEINKDEMFWSYISSFDKEIQALKNKNKKSDKEDIKKEIKNKEETIIEKKDLDLDKLIEEVKTKEEILAKEKVPTPVKSKTVKEEIPSRDSFISSNESQKKKINNRNFFILLATILIIITSRFAYYRIFDKKLDNQNSKIDTNNVQFNNNSWTFLSWWNIINTWNTIKVNQKLIKHFKNKQNSDKIEPNKN